MFNLQCKNCDESNGSMNFLLVINMLGDVVSVRAHNETMSVDALHPSPVTSKEVYLAMNYDELENGPAATWNWGDNTFTQFGQYGYVGNSHDVQWATDSSTDVWHMPANQEFMLEKMNLATGQNQGRLNISGGVLPEAWLDKSWDLVDVNHFQFDKGDTEAYLSFRILNAFMKTETFDAVESGEDVVTAVAWIAGSHNGTLTIVDLDGTEYTPGTIPYNELYNGLGTLWAGQHNLEYYGDAGFFLFDNAYDATSGEFISDSARLLKLSVNETEETVTLEWEYELGYNSMIYGDNDLLPTSNVLTCAWPDATSLTDELDWDAQIIEVVPDTGETAWSLKIWGDGTRATQYDTMDEEIYGWMMYSVERVYEEPIIITPTCATSDSENTLSFDCYNNFKVHSAVAATYTVTNTDGNETVASGSFDFESHWAKTSVEVTLDEDTCEDGCVLTIENSVGDAKETSFSC